MKKLILFFVFLTSASFAENAYRGVFYLKGGGAFYVAPETAMAFPAGGLGLRVSKGHHGLDLSVGLGYAFWKKKGGEFFLKTSLLYLHYLRPNEEKSFYYGGGVGVALVDSQGWPMPYANAEAVFGREYPLGRYLRGFTQLELTKGVAPFDSFFALAVASGAGF